MCVADSRSPTRSVPDPDIVREAEKKVLTVIGQLNAQTQMAMQMPMCGSMDNEAEVLRGPYHGSRWKMGNYSYRIVNYPPYLSRKDVDKTIAEAFNAWSQITGLGFIKKKRIADIHITFNHSESKFDGMGCIVASARYPVDNGHIYFNGNIRWTLGDTGHDCTEVNLYHTAVHEIGHSIGLFHSSYPSSVMAPIIMDSNAHIHPNDMMRARMLYNIDIPAEISENNFTSKETTPSICNLERMDAIIAYNEGHFIMYVFSGHQYWLVDAWTRNLTFSSEYPKNITETWQGLSVPIDTAFVSFENVTYFLKGHRCWKYLSGEDTPAPGYPRSISEEFPGIPDDIDAATAYSTTKKNNTIYFVKGNEYWKFLTDEPINVAQKYPQPIESKWSLDVNRLDAMLFFANYNEEMYFFKDMLYCRSVETDTKLEFTRFTKFWWFNC